MFDCLVNTTLLEMFFITDWIKLSKKKSAKLLTFFLQGNAIMNFCQLDNFLNIQIPLNVTLSLH